MPAMRPRLLEYTILGWSADSKQIYYLSLGPRSSSVNAVDTEGHITNIYRDESALIVFPRSVAVSRDMKTAVFVRSTNLVPAELVAVDLKTGTLTTLARPNAVFDAKAAPSIRFIPVETDADAFGRLYLPPDYQPGKRYPLVITQYYSYPGFVASVGDEVPVEALLSRHSQ